MAKEKLTENNYSPLKNRKIDTISTDQLEYTAEKVFTYSCILIAAMAVITAVIYMGAQQLKK